jgi:dimethylglycine dehydrogenase
VTIENLTDQWSGIAIAGPQSRGLLARLTSADVGSTALPFMSVRRLDVGLAPAIVGRVSVTGELGYEIYVPAPYLQSVFDAAMANGRDLGVRLAGMYAVNSLRLEKSFGIWSREFSRDYTPAMARLERFLAYDKPSFIGRDAALRKRGSEPSIKLVTLAIETTDADASGYEPIYRGDRYVGFVTSGGYGHTVGTSLAMGYVDQDVAADASGLSVPIMGRPCTARLLQQPAVDPQGLRMKQ